MAFPLFAPSSTTKLSSPYYPQSFKQFRPTIFFSLLQRRKQTQPQTPFSSRQNRNTIITCCLKLENSNAIETEEEKNTWGKVSAVLFDMDGVLCDSEESSRLAGVDVFAEMGVQVTTQDFIPFMGTGEANFLGGVARVKGVEGFNAGVTKKRFFEIYIDKYAKPNSGIGFPGALELITECKQSGLKVAVASSADRIKVNANLAAAGLPLSLFDAIVSADAFDNLKPAPDIFIAASKSLDIPPSECVVIEDALAGVQAAKAAQMRCIAITTTLSDETLKQAGPSLIRKEIRNISLKDILGGCGISNCPKEKMQGSHNIDYVKQVSPKMLKEETEAKVMEDTYPSDQSVISSRRLSGVGF